MLLVLDIETEAIENPQKLWVVVTKDIDTEEVSVFREPLNDPIPLVRHLKAATGFIAHNGLGYDIPHLNRLLGQDVIATDSVIDTLVVSRLLNQGMDGGHSLEAWGLRLKSPKGDFHDFSDLSEEMVTYCIQDVNLTHKLFNHFKPYIYSNTWKSSLRVEHEIATICYEMHDNGFGFDKDKALGLYQEIDLKVKALDTELLLSFPPKPKLLRVVYPKVTKHGTLSRTDFRWSQSPDLTAYSLDAPFSLIEFVPFNPGSPKQIVERLNQAGWEPTEKTKGHIKLERELRWCRDKAKRKELQEKLEHYKIYGWSISEDNLLTLPETAPEACKKLVERLILASRRSTLNEWIEAARPQNPQEARTQTSELQATSMTTEATKPVSEPPRCPTIDPIAQPQWRIHGTFHGLGAWTGRMSHSNPNQGNVPAEINRKGLPQPYGPEMRSCWKAGNGRYLVGVDAEGIQLRVLAHLMNDERFTKSLVEGKKEDGTDTHSLNKLALGDVCRGREVAKTFIYAWLLGAGDRKVAEILSCSLGESKAADAKFLDFYPGLKSLKEDQIPRDAARGYFIGLDGRLVICNSEHLMLAGYLQNGEAVIMKHANVLWKRKLKRENVPYKQVDFVHDEWQTETPRDLELATYVAKTQADAIRQVGIDLGLRCPLAGSILNTHKQLAIGDNWSQTH